VPDQARLRTCRRTETARSARRLRSPPLESSRLRVLRMPSHVFSPKTSTDGPESPSNVRLEGHVNGAWARRAGPRLARLAGREKKTKVTHPASGYAASAQIPHRLPPASQR